MTLTEHALRGAVLEAGATNRLAIGLPWFRSMPFSSITGIELLLEGTPVRDVRLDAADRSEQALGYWFLQDRHALVWSGSVPNGRADVVLRMCLRLPNLVLPDGSPPQVLQEVRGVVPVAR